VQRVSDVIGRSVVAREGGETIGKVKDLIVDTAGRQVLGFIVSESLFKGAKVVPWAGVQAIGPDAVVVSSAASIVKAGDVPDIKAVLDKDLSIHGLRLQTTAGKELGKIDDVQFDEHTGAVLGYELAGGVFGRNSFMPTPLSLELGKDLAFVGAEAEATIAKVEKD
jgi:uncharacterized protein YrrD